MVESLVRVLSEFTCSGHGVVTKPTTSSMYSIMSNMDIDPGWILIRPLAFKGGGDVKFVNCLSDHLYFTFLGFLE